MAHGLGLQDDLFVDTSQNQPFSARSLNLGGSAANISATTPQATDEGPNFREILENIAFTLSATGAGLAGRPIPESPVVKRRQIAAQNQKLLDDKLKRDLAITDSLFNIAKDMLPDQKKKFLENAIAEIPELNSNVRQLLLSAGESPVDAAQLQAIIGGDLNQQEQAILQQGGVEGLLEFHASDAGKQVRQEKADKQFLPSALDKINQISGDLKTNLDPKTFERVMRDGALSINELEQVNDSLTDDTLKLTPEELETAQRNPDRLQGFGIIGGETEAAIQQKRLEQQFNFKSDESLKGTVVDKDNNPVGFMKFNKEDGAITFTDLRNNQIEFDPKTMSIVESVAGGEGKIIGGKAELTTGAETQFQKDLKVSQEQIETMRQLGEEFEPEFLTVQGKLAAEVGNLLDKIGAPDILGAKELNTAKRSFIAKTDRLFSRYRKAVTGAQAAVKELEILRKEFISGDLAPDVFKQIWSDIFDAEELRIKNLSTALSGGIDVSGETPEKPVIGEDEVSDVEAEAIAQERFEERKIAVQTNQRLDVKRKRLEELRKKADK